MPKFTRENGPMILHDFILQHREELIARARAKVALRSNPVVTHHELTQGVPMFLTQLGDILHQEAAETQPDSAPMKDSARKHGRELLESGFTIAQVVHDYGDLCQAITELALDLNLPVDTDDFKTLNRCLDNAIASAVTEYARQNTADMTDAETRRQGFFAHELRNHLSTAMLAFQVVKSGKVGVTGSTIEVLERSLRGLNTLIDRSLSEVRLASGRHLKERIRVARFLEEMEVDASLVAMNLGLRLTVTPTNEDLFVDVDRHLFRSAVSNLLQNALKFTRPASHVWLRSHSTPEHVTIEVEDECGGMAPGVADVIFQPFEQRGTDRAGLGLGLAISRHAIEADGGTLTLVDKPGKGCVFSVRMPLALNEPLVQVDRRRS